MKLYEDIKEYLNHNMGLIVVLTTCLAIADNIWMLVLKLALESVAMATLWVIIEAIEYIKGRDENE